MLSSRTKLSLCQYLYLQDRSFASVLLEKYGLHDNYSVPFIDGLRSLLLSASEDRVHSLLAEVIRTQGDLRNRVSPRYRYDERWDDLVRCLHLDGYTIRDKDLVAADPTIEASPPLEDDLSSELQRSGLSQALGITQLLEKSADAFRRIPPDYNGCLTNARVALQTTATAIASAWQEKHPGTYDHTKWGEVLTYLRRSSFVTEAEEKGLAGVFGFVSPGAHIPIGFTQDEMVRLARSLIASMCYFLIKRYKGQP